MNSIIKLTQRRSHQTGIALFQVLLITAVISVLAIQFTQTAKHQVSIANTLANRVTAQVKMKSAESELLFALLTQELATQANANAPLTAQWNFFGEPFSTSAGVTYRIQDQNALVSLFRNNDVNLLSRAFQLLAMTNANAFAASVIDWQDADDFTLATGAERGDYQTMEGEQLQPSNMPLQTYQELAYIKGLSPNSWQEIKPFVTIRPQTYINPKLAPIPLLALHLPNNLVDTVVKLRENNQLTDQYFSSLTGLSNDEGVFFSASGSLRVQITVKVEDVEFTQSSEFEIQPYSRHPMVEYEKGH
jgi:general secretion pathway protein K